MNPEAERLEKLLHVYKGLVEVSALINGITDSAELMPAILDVARRGCFSPHKDTAVRLF